METRTERNNSFDEQREEYIKKTIVNILRQYPIGLTEGQLFERIPYTVGSFAMYQRALQSLKENNTIIVIPNKRDSQWDKIKIRKPNPIRSFLAFFDHACKMYFL